MTAFKGGCLCGAVRYRGEGDPKDQTHCHCSACRKSAGAAYLTWVTFPNDRFRFTAGEPRFYRSSERAERGFCPSCGTQLVFRLFNGSETDVTAASMDDPSHPALTPKDHIWMESHIPWAPVDDLPKHRQRRLT